MAEILDKIIGKATGNYYAIEEPLIIDSTLEITTRPELSYLTEYQFGVELGYKLRIEPHQREEALMAIRSGLREAIFGEFRAPLSRVSYLLYSREIEKARQEIDDIKNRMFYS